MSTPADRSYTNARRAGRTQPGKIEYREPKHNHGASNNRAARRAGCRRPAHPSRPAALQQHAPEPTAPAARGQLLVVAACLVAVVLGYVVDPTAAFISWVVLVVGVVWIDRRLR